MSRRAPKFGTRLRRAERLTWNLELGTWKTEASFHQPLYLNNALIQSIGPLDSSSSELKPMIERFTADQKNFATTLRQLARTISKTADVALL